jgi:zinc-binding alcohol dehydrogenase family protein
MKAIGTLRPLPTDHPEALIEFETPVPKPEGHDLLVAVRAVSVNPVDTKVRRSATATDSTPRILGWDAVGVVESVGPKVTRFRPGDRVWYAGSIKRVGSNAEYQLVDERIVGHAPASLPDAAAAAFPLTAITAWELLFDRLRVSRSTGSDGSLLIVGAAGGVGSILTQLARQLTQLTVIGTASRPETRAWVESMGAHHVIDHKRPLAAQVLELRPAGVELIAGLTKSDSHFAQFAEAVAPQGAIALIDDIEPIDIRVLKHKSVALHWESMFTRSSYSTADLSAQGTLLDELATLVDAGTIRSTLAEHGGRIDAPNLLRAHAKLESGRSLGKIVLEGF